MDHLVRLASAALLSPYLLWKPDRPLLHDRRLHQAAPETLDHKIDFLVGVFPSPALLPVLAL